MRRIRPHLLPLAMAPLLASCVFLLDYDELQDHAGSQAAGGMVGAGGGAAGEAGSPAVTCGDCNDHDPCTIDTCDQTGDAPLCVHEATEGLKLDGFEVTLPAERHVRVTLVASGKLFYLAALQVNEATPELALYRLASEGTELEPIGTDLRFEGTPVSNVGLAVEELALGEAALHGFVAIKPKVGDLAPRVFHLVNRADKTTTNLVGAAYKADNETVFPQALSIGGTIVGAWLQPDGTIAVHDVGAVRTDSFGTAALPATTLSLLSTADDQAAVMFTAQAGAQQALGTYVETAGQNREQLPECETRPGDYLSSSVIATQVPGLWLANVTRFGDEYLTSSTGTLLCDDGMCTAVGEDCADAKPSNGIRNIAGAAVHFEADDPGVIYTVAAFPQIAAKVDDSTTIEGKLSLTFGRVDLSAPGKAESVTYGGDPENGGFLQIAHNDTTEALGFAGPDWPAVGILPTQHVAVSWIQPSEAGDGTELHVQRYRMCIPALP
jgi:hypothetical protein